MKIVHPAGFELDFQDLRSFICNGKRNGWASGNKPIEFTDRSEGYKYVDRSLFYVDSYIGEGNFMGQEVVSWIKGLPLGNIPLWGMNYSDSFKLPEYFPAEEAKQFKKEVMIFLKGCLRNVPEDFPFRGPLDQISTEIMGRTIIYQNAVDTGSDLSTCDYKGGDRAIRNFGGNERILWRTYSDKPDFKVFDLRYNGRILVPDSCVVE